jgi:ABC-type antimicrobial peptide transport system permease subunit
VLGTEIELGAPRRFLLGSDDVIRGRWTRVLVVGVVAQDAANGDLLAPIAYTRVAGAFSDSSVALGSTTQADPRYSAIVVVADGLDAIAPVRARLEALGLSTSAPENLIESVQRYLHVVEIVLAGIGLIALVIAAIGITNAMLAAVRERRREIGVLKAIGARDRDLLRVFLLEASAMGFIGGAVGVVAGWLLARAVASVVNAYLTSQGLVGVSVGAPAAILGGGLLGATLVAIAAGTYPAVRAARLPAREAVSVG